jgi:DNA-binding NarL/FixJ family response regulator
MGHPTAAVAPVRVLIVDDHHAFSEALRALLEQVDDIQVVGTAASGSEAIDRVRVVGADVVLMDVGLPGMDGLETTRRVLGIHPDARVIVLSGQTESEARDAAIEAGASAYLVKGALVDDVVDAILEAAE